MQLDLSPLGAYRVFGGAVAELAGRMVDIADLFGAEGRALRERIGDTPGWQGRLGVLQDFVAARMGAAVSPAVAFALRRLALSGGQARIGDLATEIGWSRQHLMRRFQAEIGLGPKVVARMIRFRRACRLARQGAGSWAGIAAESGYADQAHLVRDFAALAGEPPTAWAQRMAGLDGRLAKPDGFGTGW